MRGNIISRRCRAKRVCLRCRRTRNGRGPKDPGASRPGTGPYIDELSRRTPAPKACVTLSLIKLSSPPGNEVTRALITRRLIANYERTWFASAIFTFSRASRWRAYQIREVICAIFQAAILKSSLGHIRDNERLARG